MNLVVTDPPRAHIRDVARLREFGVATVHEAMGRNGSTGPELRPIQQGLTVAGSAVTALCGPGDNLMVHVAIEQCRPGDILVIASTSPCTHGVLGELFATALVHRGVRAAISDAGVRDTSELREMGFGAWSRHVSAQGTVKATAGQVNMPVHVAGQRIAAGDVVVADDDGVVVVPLTLVGQTLAAASARQDREAEARAGFREGQLSLDRYGLRPLLADLGVLQKSHAQALRDGDLT